MSRRTSSRMYDTSTVERPRAVVFAVLPGGGAATQGDDEALHELRELLASADIDPVGEVVQHRDHPHPRSYLYPGKLRELKGTLRQTGAGVAVCEDDLSPGQVAAVLDALHDVDVLDRTELILTVFSRHANTQAGTLQVHLAQLEYELTRMRGKGTILSRLGAGVDMRGPGETKLEVDRRVVRKRIQALRRRIGQMAQTRRTQRTRRLRADVPLTCLAGYTNAGKSTLLNALTDAEVSVRDRLFETLDPTTRTYRHRDRDYVVTDTVGFIRKLPHQLVEAFASTLEETTVADLILVVADAAQPPDELSDRLATVAEVLDMIGSGEIARLLVLNKIDLVDDDRRARLGALYPEAVQVSAKTGTGLDELLDRIAGHFDRGLQTVTMLVPYADAGVVSRLRGVAADISQENAEDGIRVRARLPAEEAGRLATYRIDGGDVERADETAADLGGGDGEEAGGDDDRRPPREVDGGTD